MEWMVKPIFDSQTGPASICTMSVPHFILFLFNIYSKQQALRMSKWNDDEFDFDDLEPKYPPKKPKQQKKPKKNDDDFFDLDDQPPQKSTKLPVIAPKPKENPLPIPQNQKSAKASKKGVDDYSEIYQQVGQAQSPKKASPKKSRENSNYYEQLQQEIHSKPAEAKKSFLKQVPIKPENQQEDEQFYESIEQKKHEKSPKKAINSEPKQLTENLKHQPEQVEYLDENFDDYGEDFEEVEEVRQEVPKKSQTTVNLKSKERSTKQVEKAKLQDKKLVINTNKMFVNKDQPQKQTKIVPPVPKPPTQKENSQKLPKKTNEPTSVNAISKQKTLHKSSSKRSLQSNDSKKYLGNSKVSVRRPTVEVGVNRHMDLVERQFPESEESINQYNNEKLTRINEQVRQMIRKFNEELNELINKNMILLKEKPIERKANVDEKMRILGEQHKSNATALEVVENELDRLKGREGELREEEYQLIMEKKIEEIKQTIKQTAKAITKLKFGVNNEGNKLSKQEVQKKMAQQLHQIKLMLIQARKQEEKNDAKLQKLDKMVEDLQSKNSDKQYELSEQIDTAKDKGLQLNVNSTLKRRHQELRLKVIAVQNHKKCMQSLNKTKCDHLNYENEQARVSIKNVESQIANIHQSIDFSQQQSKKLIKKALQSQRISPALAQNLQKILKSIEQNQAINFYEVRTEGNKSQASERPLKNSMYQNMSKQKPPIRNSSSKKQQNTVNKPKTLQSSPNNDEINLMKPNFMKKKEKPETSPLHEEQKNKLYERVWSEEQQKREEEKRRKQEQKKKQQQERKRVEQQQKRKQADKLRAQEERKKPFTLKKNRMSQNKEKSIEQSPQVSIDKKPQPITPPPPPQPPQQIKQEEKPSLGPKFMRLNKRDKNPESSKLDIAVEKPIEETKKMVEQPIKIQTKAADEQQPSFVPKRFNLRNKIQKKDDSYVPSIEKASQPKQKKEELKQVKQVKKQYTPNLSFKDQQPFKAPTIDSKKVEPETKIEIPQQKPRFNLRLRDRQKKQVNDEYVPSGKPISDPVDTKPKVESNTYNPFDRDNSKKQEEKPYAPSGNQSIGRQPQKNVKGQINPVKQGGLVNKESEGNGLGGKGVVNPYAEAQKNQNMNPYAPKEDAPKRQREGPLKKNKIVNKGPKEKINIYEQAEDITEPHTHIANQPIIHVAANQPPKINLAKTDELDLNAMLGIKKKEKGNDLEELLGEVKVEKKKERKKNTDFFNDLEL